MPVNKLVKEWLEKAGDDELNIRSILAHRDGTPGLVCFLSQQMAEKLLKALLTFNKIKFKKVHDLILLENELIAVESNIEKFTESLAILNRYYIETRYPGDYPEFSWTDAEKAWEVVAAVKNFVTEKLAL